MKNFNAISTTTLKILCIFLISIVSFSCSKEDKVLSASDLLTRKNWVLFRFYEEKGTSKTWQVVKLSDSFYDDLFIFRSNGTFEWNSGAKKEHPTWPQIVTQGTWKWSTNPKYINLKLRYIESNVLNDPTLVDALFEIEELTETSLIIITDFIEEENQKFQFIPE
jgi:hypothetical protein